MHAAGRDAIAFGFYLAGVGISVTFGSLILMYFILRIFIRVERHYAAPAEAKAGAAEALPVEVVAAIGAAIEKYLEEEREHIVPELRLEERKPSVWRSSGRSDD